MTTMFFAGIPLEGSGTRPLEADLYGAQAQNVDPENLSATGNLNIGNVMQYDEHAQRFLSGGNLGDDAVHHLPDTAHDPIGALVGTSTAPRTIAADGSDAAVAQNGGSFANPQIAPAAATADTAAPVSTPSSNSSSFTGNSFNASQSANNSSNSTTTTIDNGGNGGNTTINNTQNITNTENNYTENNYNNTTNQSLINNTLNNIHGGDIIHIGDITIGGSGGGG